MWTKLMCRLWAIKHEKAYRHKAVFNGLIFLSAMVVFFECGCIYTHTLSVGGILALIICATLFAYMVMDLFRKEKK